MSFVTIWSADWQHSERLPLEVVNLLMSDGVVRPGWKPNRRGKLKPALFTQELFHKIRDLSATMGPQVTDRIVAGSWYHQCIASAWRGMVPVGL